MGGPGHRATGGGDRVEGATDVEAVPVGREGQGPHRPVGHGGHEAGVDHSGGGVEDGHPGPGGAGHGPEVAAHEQAAAARRQGQGPHRPVGLGREPGVERAAGHRQGGEVGPGPLHDLPQPAAGQHQGAGHDQGLDRSAAVGHPAIGDRPLAGVEGGEAGARARPQRGEGAPGIEEGAVTGHGQGAYGAVGSRVPGGEHGAAGGVQGPEVAAFQAPEGGELAAEKHPVPVLGQGQRRHRRIGLVPPGIGVATQGIDTGEVEAVHTRHPVEIAAHIDPAVGGGDDQGVDPAHHVGVPRLGGPRRRPQRRHAPAGAAVARVDATAHVEPGTVG